MCTFCLPPQRLETELSKGHTCVLHTSRSTSIHVKPRHGPLAAPAAPGGRAQAELRHKEFHAQGPWSLVWCPVEPMICMGRHVLHEGRFISFHVMLRELAVATRARAHARPCDDVAPGATWHSNQAIPPLRPLCKRAGRAARDREGVPQLHRRQPRGSGHVGRGHAAAGGWCGCGCGCAGRSACCGRYVPHLKISASRTLVASRRLSIRARRWLLVKAAQAVGSVVQF